MSWGLAMADRPVGPAWAMSAWFLGLSALAIFIALLPVYSGHVRFPWPDLVLGIALVCVVRRPDMLPLWPIAAVTLLGDFLFQRPPGLWTALVILGTEFLRGRATLMRDLPFLMEWAIVASVLAAMTFAYRAVLALTLVGTPPFGPTLAHLALTVLAYPVLMLLSRLVFGVDKIAPGEVDDMGRRL